MRPTLARTSSFRDDLAGSAVSRVDPLIRAGSRAYRAIAAKLEELGGGRYRAFWFTNDSRHRAGKVRCAVCPPNVRVRVSRAVLDIVEPPVTDTNWQLDVPHRGRCPDHFRFQLRVVNAAATLGGRERVAAQVSKRHHDGLQLLEHVASGQRTFL